MKVAIGASGVDTSCLGADVGVEVIYKEWMNYRFQTEEIGRAHV